MLENLKEKKLISPALLSIISSIILILIIYKFSPKGAGDQAGLFVYLAGVILVPLIAIGIFTIRKRLKIS